MSSDDAVMLFFLSVELLAQIPHFIAVGLGGMFCLLFQSLDFLLTLGEFGLKSLGLASGEAIGGSRLARLLLSLGGDDWHDRDIEVWCLLVHVEMSIVGLGASLYI